MSDDHQAMGDVCWRRCSGGLRSDDGARRGSGHCVTRETNRTKAAGLAPRSTALSGARVPAAAPPARARRTRHGFKRRRRPRPNSLAIARAIGSSRSRRRDGVPALWRRHHRLRGHYTVAWRERPAKRTRRCVTSALQQDSGHSASPTPNLPKNSSPTSRSITGDAQESLDARDERSVKATRRCGPRPATVDDADPLAEASQAVPLQGLQ